MARMSRKKMVERIIEGHVEEISEWALRDLDSLRAWLTEVLGLRAMDVRTLQEEFGSYLEE
jgi:uncharacterized membrane protein